MILESTVRLKSNGMPAACFSLTPQKPHQAATFLGLCYVLIFDGAFRFFLYDYHGCFHINAVIETVTVHPVYHLTLVR